MLIGGLKHTSRLTDCRHKMENKQPSSVKIEPDVCVNQETHCWSPSGSDLSIQEHPQKWTYDSKDMKVVKQELSDVLCEDRSHSFSKMVDIDEGRIVQVMPEHSNSESRMNENSYKGLVKYERCQMLENVSSVIDTNNKLSLSIENSQQQNNKTQGKHRQSFAKSFNDIYDNISYSSERTHTGDWPDVSIPNVCVYRYKKTQSEGMPNLRKEWNGLLMQGDHLECKNNMNQKRIHAGEQPYKRVDYGASFTRAGHLKTHKRTHTGEKPYKCDDCGASFTEACNLKIHKRMHTGEKLYYCDDCGASFNQASNLKIHKRIHTGERPYKCDDCGASFTQAGHLNSHKRTHAEEKPYKCDDCGASFIRADHIKRHMRTHTGEKPYKCDDCGASFTQAHNLKTHKRMHTGEKPYKCNDCGASFTQAGSLKTHKRTHTGEKPYKCDVCCASFTDASNLKKHKRTHTGEEAYKCDD